MEVPREEIFLTTKMPPEHYGWEATLAWVPHMLSELQLPYVDLVLLHMPGAESKAVSGL